MVLPPGRLCLGSTTAHTSGTIAWQPRRSSFLSFQTQAVPSPILAVPPPDPTFGSLNGPPNEPKSVLIKAQLAPNWVSIITSKAISISPLNYFNLRHMITKQESFVRHVIGSSGTCPILRHIILFCSFLPNRHVDLCNSNLFGIMSAPLAWCLNSRHESFADMSTDPPTRHPIFWHVHSGLIWFFLL